MTDRQQGNLRSKVSRQVANGIASAGSTVIKGTQQVREVAADVVDGLRLGADMIKASRSMPPDKDSSEGRSDG